MKILEHITARYSTRHIALNLLLTGVLGGLSTGTPASAQVANISLEIIPAPALIHEVEPEYPARAATRGIEGWIQVIFTVTPEGTVDPQSIAVVDAQPTGLFDTSAIQAIAQFRFEPLIQEGVAVEMQNRQHVFRFTLDKPEQ